MTDPIADYLTRLRNAIKAKHKVVEIPASNIKKEITKILKEKGYPEDVRRAILGHAAYMNVPRDTRMAQVLYASDELCGFISACSVVRPNKIADLEVSSVKKKLKDKGFARNVSREDIQQGIQELGIPLEEHIQFVIDAMRSDAARLGLA